MTLLLQSCIRGSQIDAGNMHSRYSSLDIQASDGFYFALLSAVNHER